MLLELKNTVIGYNTPLISGINASLESGEVGLLIGDNGMGKTTLLKTILKQIPLLEGEIFIERKNIKQLSTKQLAELVAVVFSKTVSPENYTVTDLITFGKYIYYPYYFSINKKDQKEVDEIIEKLDLTHYRNRYLNELSDGNLQKAYIGRALAQNSPLIILDEPTTHLDEKNKINILKILRELAKTQNKIILFSSHDWRLSKEFSDKIWYLTHQKLYSGITEDILLQHQELLRPQLFDLDKNFIAPTINAPKEQAEMLYSFLQKNFKKDLSSFQFTFSQQVWEISGVSFQKKAANFQELSNILSNLH